jgi:hypothetical protein
MRSQLDIDCHIVSKPNEKFCLMVYGDNYTKFIDGVSDFIAPLSCLKYKIDTSKIGLCSKSNAKNHDRHNNIAEAKKLWSTGSWTKKDIASKFEVTRGTVYTWLK